RLPEESRQGRQGARGEMPTQHGHIYAPPGVWSIFVGVQLPTREYPRTPWLPPRRVPAKISSAYAHCTLSIHTPGLATRVVGAVPERSRACLQTRFWSVYFWDEQTCLNKPMVI